ncbi:MAG: hypothetical protein ACXAEU_05635 [Candidatus Hodarchaeales archaeon]
MIWILDSSAVINSRGVVSLARGEQVVTTDLIVAEIKDFTSRMLLEVLQSSTDFSTIPVSRLQGEMALVERKAALSKDQLSTADLSVAALAFHFHSQSKVNTVLTDDYRLQNLLSILGLLYRPVIMTGIKTIKNPRFTRCKACNRQLEEEKVCQHCGTIN